MSSQNDKQEQERAEKYFIRASVEAVTTQIHGRLCLSGCAHTAGVVGGLRVRAEELSDEGFWGGERGSFRGRLSEAADEDRSQ